MTVASSTFSANHATYYGGAIDNYYSLYAVTVGDSILAGDSAYNGPDVWNAVASSGNNLIGETNGSSGWVSSDLTGTAANPLDPMLVPRPV